MSLKKKIKPLFFALSLILGGFVFNSNVFAFDLNGCNPISNPLNLCQEQTYYPAVDIKLTPYGTEYFVTLNNGVFSSVPGCSDNVFSMLIKNTSTSQDLVFIKGGQYGFCEYGQDINAYNSNIPDGDYFYELYTGTSWGNRVAHGYIRLYKIDGVWTAQSSSTDGSCGSDHLQTLDNEPTNLCNPGTPQDPLTYIPYQGWVWICYGSGGGSDDICQAYASETFLSGNTLSVQCGSSTNISQTIMPTGSQACYLGLGGDMIQNEDDSWSWTCTSDTDSISCSTLPEEVVPIPPTLPSDNSISCSISPTDFSTFGDCLGSIFRWLFLPSQSTLNSYYALPSLIYTQMPFGFIKGFQNSISSLNFRATSDLTIPIIIQEHQYDFFSVAWFKNLMGLDAENFYFSIIKAMLWIRFLIWAYDRGREIFAHRQLTLGI